MFNTLNDEIIYVNKSDTVEYIQFKILLKYGIKHCYTLKKEGISFSSKSEYEEESYKKICHELDIDENTLIKPIQAHTSTIKCIDKVLRNEDMQDIDGLITNKKDIALSTKNADCILFLFFDPVKRVISNVHSGWRGTFKKIVEKAVVKMITDYKCEAKNIICCISPSIRKCHFEVDSDVKDMCEDIFGFTGKTKEFIEVGKIQEGKVKYMIDTVMINKILLLELGIEEKNIIDSNLCSVCNKDKINSFRVEGKRFNNATAIITL